MRIILLGWFYFNRTKCGGGGGGSGGCSGGGNGGASGFSYKLNRSSLWEFSHLVQDQGATFFFKLFELV